MSDNIKDVNEDLETSSEESTEENLEEKGKDVPYDRFSKVIEERNKLREEAEALRKEREALNDALNPKKEEKKPAASETLSRDEAILYARGLSNEAVEKAKKIAIVEDVSLSEAVETQLFKSWQDQQETEKKQSNAQLGASTGSAPYKEETFTPGMDKNAHKELWRKAMNQ